VSIWSGRGPESKSLRALGRQLSEIQAKGVREEGADENIWTKEG
jgi:hypothetical protein